MLKKVLSVLLAAALAVSVSVLPAGAAEKLSPKENNARISDSAEALEQKYGVDITYSINPDGYASITMNNLETLDRALSTVTPSVVKQVSQYYRRLNGARIDFNYVFSSTNYYNGGVVMAAFERTTSKIYIFMPSKAGSAIVSGENPIALVHEFAHAFHLMCMDSYGERQMRAEWSEFNNGVRYDKTFGYDNPDVRTFISVYASTSFEEDFAETFAHTFVRSVPGAGFRNLLAKDSKLTGLGRKVNYIEELLRTYLDEPSEAIENYRKIYDTPTSVTFEGIKFSGEYLQYTGYPQPRNILKGMLNELDLTSRKSTWVRSLGAWRVIDERGDTYFVFPGGSWTAARTGRVMAAAA